MQISFNISRTIEAGVLRAATELADFDDSFTPDVRPADPRFGDFQVNGVLPYAKKSRKNPRELAQRLQEALPGAGFDTSKVSLSVAGPGFINVSFTPEYLIEWLVRHDTEAHLREGASEILAGKTVVVDFSSPNAAKQMHVGHLRSMVIGESICRLVEFCGAHVIRDDHIGDWGTPLGKVILGYKRFLDRDALSRDALAELERLYKKVNSLCEEDPAILQQAREELVRLQRKEPENYNLWKEIISINNTALEEVYSRLNIRFDHQFGESFYEDKLDRIYDELTREGIAEESQGALVVFHPEHPRFATQPLIIRKSDGASNYASTDLATVLFRCEEWNADGIIYVTDGRQQDHFQQLFLTVEKWFAATGRKVPQMDHVWFGTILGEDGKAIKTRSGDPIRLKALLDEAVERARKIVDEKSPHLDEAERRSIAETVGVSAVRYADLAQNRTGDYVFSWEKLLSFDGNTAPYMLYAIARIHSIFAKINLDPESLTGDMAPLTTATETALARKLLGFSAVLHQTLGDLRPHYICTFLFELSGEFSSFYKADRVLVDDPALRRTRLLLCARTLLILESGLHLLGIPTLKRM